MSKNNVLPEVKSNKEQAFIKFYDYLKELGVAHVFISGTHSFNEFKIYNREPKDFDVVLNYEDYNLVAKELHPKTNQTDLAVYLEEGCSWGDEDIQVAFQMHNVKIDVFLSHKPTSDMKKEEKKHGVLHGKEVIFLDPKFAIEKKKDYIDAIVTKLYDGGVITNHALESLKKHVKDINEYNSKKLSIKNI